jgi:exosome complex component MTR3
LEDDGVLAALAAAITCASIALADSGIELYDLVTGCSAGVSEKNVILDLTEQEQEDLTSQELEGTKGCAFLVLATMSGLNEITLVEQTGSVSTKQSVRVFGFNIGD